MKEKADLVRRWLRKAASDIVSMEATLAAGALDGIKVRRADLAC